jgi:hypothetical protein
MTSMQYSRRCSGHGARHLVSILLTRWDGTGEELQIHRRDDLLDAIVALTRLLPNPPDDDDELNALVVRTTGRRRDLVMPAVQVLSEFIFKFKRLLDQGLIEVKKVKKPATPLHIFKKDDDSAQVMDLTPAAHLPRVASASAG